VIIVSFHVVAEESTRFDEGERAFWLWGRGESFLGRKGPHDLC